jgi:squalene cyclase
VGNFQATPTGKYFDVRSCPQAHALCKKTNYLDKICAVLLVYHTGDSRHQSPETKNFHLDNQNYNVQEKMAQKLCREPTHDSVGSTFNKFYGYFYDLT